MKNTINDTLILSVLKDALITWLDETNIKGTYRDDIIRKPELLARQRDAYGNMVCPPAAAIAELKKISDYLNAKGG